MAQPFWGLNMLNQALDQRKANALAERRLGMQEEQNALSRRVQEAKLGQLNREQALSKLQTAGPLAKMVSQDPSSYPQIRAQYMELTGDPLPESYEEAKPLIDQAATLYDRMNPPEPVDVEYVTTASGERVALPKQAMRGQGKITPLRTGVMAPEETGGPLITMENPDTGDVKTLRRDSPKVDEFLRQGYLQQRKPVAEVSITPETAVESAEKKATEKFAENIGKKVSQRYQQAEEAVNQNALLDQVALALAEGADTGMGEETILNLKNLGQTLGFDTGDLSGQELIRKVSNEMALRLRNPESGLGLPGNTSNKDLQFLKDAVIGLSRTEEGNRAIITAMRRFNQLRKDLAIKQNEIIAENDGVVPIDIDSKLMEYVNEYDIFTKSERNKIESYLGDGEGGVPTPKTQEEYEKLSPGTIYIDPEDGQRYRKP